MARRAKVPAAVRFVEVIMPWICAMIMEAVENATTVKMTMAMINSISVTPFLLLGLSRIVISQNFRGGELTGMYIRFIDGSLKLGGRASGGH